MPRLIFNGNLEENFGDQYPVPYIYRIYITENETNEYDSNVSEALKLDLQIYLAANNNAEPVEEKQQIDDLYVYAGFIIGEDVDNLIQDRVDIFDLVKASTITGEDISVSDMRASYELSDLLSGGSVEGYEDICPGGLCASAYAIPTVSSDLRDPGNIGNNVYCLSNYKQLKISDFVGIETEDGSGDLSYYDEAAKVQYYRYSATISIPMVGDEFTWSNLLAKAYSSEDGTENLRKMSAFCFASHIDITSTENTIAGGYANVTTAEALSYSLVKKLSHGDVSYENIFRDNQLLTDPQPVYVDSRGEYYNEVPMRSLDGTYHKSGRHSEFSNNLLGPFTTGSVNDNVSDFIGNVIEMVNEFQNSPELLVKSNQLKLAFPDKNAAGDSATQYNEFKNTIATENAITRRQDIVTQKLIKNAKIIDSRAGVQITTTYDSPSPSPEQCESLTDPDSTENRIYSSEVSNSSLFRMTRYAFSTSEGQALTAGGVTEGLSNQEYLEWNYENVMCNYGVIWFDYEKALRNDTYLSEVFNIDKLELWFGKSFTQGALRFHETTLRRFYKANAVMDIVTAYDSSNVDHLTFAGSAITLTPDHYNNISHDYDIDYGEAYAEIETGINGTKDYSYCVLRNFVDNRDYGQDSIVVNGYRLAGFQFQDYYDIALATDALLDDGTTQESYQFNINMVDYSYTWIKYIAESYKVALENYRDFVELCQENCNYSTENSGFTDVFKKGIADTYEADPTSAPFVIAPIIFNLHRDILFDQHNGEQDGLLSESLLQTSLINPETATLEQIQNFLALMESLYTTYYDESEGTIFNDLLSGVSGTNALQYCNTFDFPEIFHGGESEEEYLEELELYGAYETSDWSSSPTFSRTILATDAIDRMQELASYLNNIWIRYYDPFAGGGLNVSAGCCLWNNNTNGNGFDRSISTADKDCGGSIIGDGLQSWSRDASGHDGVYNYVNDMIVFLESMRSYNYDDMSESDLCKDSAGNALESCMVIEAERNADTSFYTWQEPACPDSDFCFCWRMVDITTGLDVTIDEWGDAVKEFVMLAYPNEVINLASPSLGREYDGAINIKDTINDIGVDTGSSACGWDCGPADQNYRDLYS